MGTVGQRGTNGLAPRGNEGQFGSIQSETFNLKIINPCMAAQINPVQLLPDDYSITGDTPSLSINLGAESEPAVFKYYEEPGVTGPLGSVPIYDNCSELSHYLTDYN